MVAQVTQNLPTGLASFDERKAASSAPNNDELGRQEFLKLLTTQLQNQNPLDPMKNEQFVAQLAQFSTLEATLSMSGSLDNFVTSRKENDVLQASNLIGRSVAVSTGEGFLQTDSTFLATQRFPPGLTLCLSLWWVPPAIRCALWSLDSKSPAPSSLPGMVWTLWRSSGCWSVPP